MKYIFIILLLSFALQSCKKEEEDLNRIDEKKLKEEMAFSRKVIGAEIFKGMYTLVNDSASFTECKSMRNYSLGGEGEPEDIRNEYIKFETQFPKKPAYIEFEAFRSTRSDNEKSVSDTVLVVTRFIKFLGNKTCDDF
ncbi:MAG: hypothetical protein JSS91_05495 [Bacteroidetes bacterium]|nr:hypothetical protein [Bacteroidota bacterium]